MRTRAQNARVCDLLHIFPQLSTASLCVCVCVCDFVKVASVQIFDAWTEMVSFFCDVLRGILSRKLLRKGILDLL